MATTKTKKSPAGQYKVVMRYGQVVVAKRRDTNYRVRWPEGGGRPERSFKTEDEAKRFALQMATALEEGGGRKPAPKGLFSELVAEAISPTRHRGWSVRHAQTMEALARNHVLNEPAGALKCTAVTKETLTNLLQDVVDAGYAINTAAQVRKVLLIAVRRGIDLGIWTEGNQPMRGVRVPRPRAVDDVPVELHRITAVPSAAQVAALVEHFEARSPKVPGYSGGGLLVRFAAETGLRQGEQLALQKRHIDFDRKVVRVRRTAERDNSGRASFKRPKTESSLRDVPITEALAEALAELCENKGDEDLVFTAKRGGIWNRSYLTKLVRSCADYDPYRWHDLRHYRATALFHAGADAAAVAGFLGHSNPFVTMTMYVGTSPQAVDNLRALI
jgi:integrase